MAAVYPIHKKESKMGSIQLQSYLDFTFSKQNIRKTNTQASDGLFFFSIKLFTCFTRKTNIKAK